MSTGFSAQGINFRSGPVFREFNSFRENPATYQTDEFISMFQAIPEKVHSQETVKTAPQAGSQNMPPSNIQPLQQDEFRASNTPAAAQINQQSKRTGPIQGVKNFIAGFKKAWINVSEYTKGTVLGAAEGTVLGALTYGGIRAVKYVRGAASTRPKLLGKIGVGLAAVAGLGHSLFKASLNVSERTANVDHRFNTGHRFQ